MKMPVLLNRAEQTLSFFIFRALFIAITLSLSACIPSIQTIYHTPVILGQVIDLETLTPIEGAIIKHEGIDAEYTLDEMIDAAENKIVTNQEGEYRLPSTSSLEAILLMPGHAIHSYPVRISTRYNSALVFASASLLMRTEEITAASLLILDPAPQIIANPPSGGYLADVTLRGYLYPHSTLGHCDLGIGHDAISALNTARKAYWHHQTSSDHTQTIVNAAYLNVHQIWQYFYDSCDFGDDRSQQRYAKISAVREITDTIQQEARDLTK